MVPHIALLLALAAAPLVHGYPGKLGSCTRDISASATIMGQSVEASTAKTVQLTGQACGGTIVIGTAYSLTMGGAASNFVVDLSGTAAGTFATKQTLDTTEVCEKRTTTSSDTVTFTAAGTAIFRMTTAPGYGTATTTENTCDYTVQDAATTAADTTSTTTAADATTTTTAAAAAAATTTTAAAAEGATTTSDAASETTAAAANAATTATVSASTTTPVPDIAPDGTPQVFVEVSVTVPLTIAEFTDAKRVSFRKGIANAAGTAIDKVEITQVSAANRRRMLLETSISVDFRVSVTEAQATELTASGAFSEAKLNEKLKAEGLPAVTVTKAATVTKSAAHRLAGGGMLARTLLSLGVALLVHRAAALG